MQVSSEIKCLKIRDEYVSELGGEIYYDWFSETHPPTALDYGHDRLSQAWTRISFIRKDNKHIASIEYRTKDCGQTFTITKIKTEN